MAHLTIHQIMLKLSGLACKNNPGNQLSLRRSRDCLKQFPDARVHFLAEDDQMKYFNFRVLF